MRRGKYLCFLSVTCLLVSIAAFHGKEVHAASVDFDPEGHGAIVESGPCGATDEDSARYDLYEDGMCHIYGQRAVADSFFYDNKSIVKVFIDQDIKDLGGNDTIAMPGIEMDSSELSPFVGCDNLVSIEVSTDNGVYTSKDNCNAVIRREDNALIAGCSETVVPDGVTAIGGGAFYYCKGLTEITLPDSVKRIYANAFSGCEALTTVNLSSELTRIGESSFAGCGSLTNVSIPASVNEVGMSAFERCDKLLLSVATDSEAKAFLSEYKLTEKDNNNTAKQTVLVYYGDFDGDQEVNLNDVVCCLRLALGIDQATNDQLLCGDIDGGGISLSDATAFLNIALGIESMKTDDISVDFTDSYMAQKRVWRSGEIVALTEIEGEDKFEALTEEMYEETPLYNEKDAMIYKVKEAKELSLTQKLALRKMFDMSEDDFYKYMYFKGSFLWNDSLGYDGLKITVEQIEDDADDVAVPVIGGDKDVKLKFDFNAPDLEQDLTASWRTVYFKASKGCLNYKNSINYKNPLFEVNRNFGVEK